MSHSFKVQSGLGGFSPSEVASKVTSTKEKKLKEAPGSQLSLEVSQITFSIGLNWLHSPNLTAKEAECCRGAHELLGEQHCLVPHASPLLTHSSGCHEKSLPLGSPPEFPSTGSKFPPMCDLRTTSPWHAYPWVAWPAANPLLGHELCEGRDSVCLLLSAALACPSPPMLSTMPAILGLQLTMILEWMASPYSGIQGSLGSDLVHSTSPCPSHPAVLGFRFFVYSSVHTPLDFFRQLWISLSAPVFTGYRNLGKLLHCSMPQVPHLSNRVHYNYLIPL